MKDINYKDLLIEKKRLFDLNKDRQLYRISILGNVTLSTCKEVFEYGCLKLGLFPKVEIGNFDNLVQDSMNVGENDLVIIVYDLYSTLESKNIFLEGLTTEEETAIYEDIVAQISQSLKNLSSVSTVIVNRFSIAHFTDNVLFHQRARILSEQLNNFLDSFDQKNLVSADIDQIYIKIGLSKCFDYRFFYTARIAHSFDFYKNYFELIQPIIYRNTGRFKKALIFDCDNTLWKGIVGEDGKDGVQFSKTTSEGKYYEYIQRIAVWLSRKGVIIGLCSKNNEDDVLEVLNMPNAILKVENITIHRINWDNKVNNLRSIAKELNIGIDSLVFVDDSSFEIELVKESLPEVTTLIVPKEISIFPKQLFYLVTQLFNMKPTSDDLNKTLMYKTQQLREASKSSSISVDDYLRSLQISCIAYLNEFDQIPRIAQLTQKTNQFNLTTKRYTESEIKYLMDSDSYDVISLSVSDKFGESGLTAVCILYYPQDSKEVAEIDSFLMSCRIIGRNIEYQFLNLILNVIAISRNIKEIIGIYSPTKKNQLSEKFYSEAGFSDGLLEGNSYFHKYSFDKPIKEFDYINLSLKK